MWTAVVSYLVLGNRSAAFNPMCVGSPLFVESLELVINQAVCFELDQKGFWRVQNALCVLHDHLLFPFLIPSTSPSHDP
jgi:hypothetical protein